ncbi:hypothetical protein ACVNF4_15135 [Streptomyces sp. S6]
MPGEPTLLRLTGLPSTLCRGAMARMLGKRTGAGPHNIVTALADRLVQRAE